MGSFFLAAHVCNMWRSAVARPVRGNHDVALVRSTHGTEQRPWVASSHSRCEQEGWWRWCMRSSCNGTILAPTAHVLARNTQNGSHWQHCGALHRMCSPASFKLTSMRWKRSARSPRSSLHCSQVVRPLASAVLSRSTLSRVDLIDSESIFTTRL